MSQVNKMWDIIASAAAKNGLHNVFYVPGLGGRALARRLEDVILARDVSQACQFALLKSRSNCRSLVSVGSEAGVVIAPALIDAVYNGVGAGLVVVAPAVEQLPVTGLLWLQPFSARSLAILARAAPLLSEKFGLPVLFSTEFMGGDADQQSPFPPLQRILEIADCFAGEQFAEDKTAHLTDKRPLAATKQAAVRRFAHELGRQIVICTA